MLDWYRKRSNMTKCQECNWECSDVPGLFYCTNCDSVRQWNRFAQAYSFYVREGHYGF